MNKHTKGPWKVSETRHKYDIVIRDADNAPVAIVVLAGYPGAEAKANAHMVAAAPDLLAALQAMFSENGDFDFTVTMLGNARAAIAKATGA